jgi:hypothetical protein
MKKMSKTSLVAWSVVLGLVITFGVFAAATTKHWVNSKTVTPSTEAESLTNPDVVLVKYDFGFPFRMYDASLGFGDHIIWKEDMTPLWTNFILDALFWIVISFAIFSGIRALGSNSNEKS